MSEQLYPLNGRQLFIFGGLFPVSCQEAAMFQKIKRRMLPITITRGLKIVMNLANPDTDTDKWYEYAVKSFVDFHDDVLVTSVTPDMVRQWSKSLDENPSSNGEPYSEWTKNSYRRAIRAFFNKLVVTGHLEHPGPAASWKIPAPPKNQPRHLTEGEVKRVRQHAKANLRDHAILEMMYATGCRISELGTMRVSNLHIEASEESSLSKKEKTLLELAKEADLQYMVKPDFGEQLRGKIIVIGKGQNGKKKIRWAYFGHEACQALRNYLDSRPHNSPDPIFLNNKGEPLTRYGFHHVMQRIFKDAGVTARTHDLRHTFAYRLIRGGADPKIVQRLLGHSELSTTLDIYYNPTDDELWEAYDQYT